MKRFYCTVCKRVRRVRRLPIILSENLNEKAVVKQFGECDKHSQPRQPRAPKFSELRNQPVFVATTAKKVAGKRGR